MNDFDWFEVYLNFIATKQRLCNVIWFERKIFIKQMNCIGIWRITVSQYLKLKTLFYIDDSVFAHTMSQAKFC